jgi:short-chain Z-isoprenyl diphosphate synthase
MTVALPEHVAIIPDGNRRFARCRGLALDEGYLAGARKGIEAVGWCLEAGVRHVSVFALSADNLERRPAHELAAALRAVAYFVAGVQAVHAVGIEVVGDVAGLPAELPGRDVLGQLSGGPLDARRPVVHAAVNYSAEFDLAALAGAARRWPEPLPARQVVHLTASGNVPEIDLLIRPGGRRRLSGFLPLQSAQAELWFSDSLWPEFDRGEFAAALAWYGGQERCRGE